MSSHFKQPISEQIWYETYKWETDHTVDDTWRREARAVSKAEKEDIRSEWEEKFYRTLRDFTFVPGGRVMSNAGTGLKNTTLINCYVSGFEGKHQDSLDGIYRELHRQAKILASEGGYGINFSVLRPRGSFVHGIGVETCGVVEFMKLWDISSGVLTAGSGIKKKSGKGKNKIRKGAQMGMLFCWHPSVEEFITAKLQPGALTKFNMTVLLTDDFMSAVKEHKPWNLEFPDTTYDAYGDEWDGNLDKWKSKDYPVNVWKTYADANDLYDLIMTSTYTRNEPGVAFIDRVNELNNLKYCEHINASNPSLRKGTKVLTKGGIYNIEDLEDTEFYVKNLNGVWSFAKCFLSGNDKQLFKVSLTNGKDIYATKEHKWAVSLVGGGFGKVTTADLRSGNYLPIREEDTLSMSCDKEFSYDEGFMVGWLYGDGWISDRNNKAQIGKRVYGFCFNQQELYIAEKILPVVNSLKKQPSNITKVNDSLFYIQITDSDFDLTMKHRYKVDHKKFGIPVTVWNSGEQYLKGFIDGIFSSDGSARITDSNKQIVFTNKHHTIISDLFDLLGFYGIKARIGTTTNDHAVFPNGKNYHKSYTINTLHINNYNAYRFSKIFNITHAAKQVVISNINKIYTDSDFRVAERGLVQIASVEQTAIYEDVWDISVFDETHCFQISSCTTGNCGEQFLPINGACNLGSINLTQFIDNGKINYKKLDEHIPTLVRFQDNILDITNFPVKEQRKEAEQKRRVGIGYMGYGSALYLLKLAYGSAKALALTEELANYVTNKIYQASALLAKEKGPFPLYNKEKYLASEFVKNSLTSETIAMIAKYGIRNSHLTTCAPTGNTGIVSNNVSGGLEPVISPEYIRTVITSVAPEGITIPIVDWTGRKFTGSDNFWEWVTEGDEHILKCIYGGTVYKVDRSRGLCREEKVMDYAIIEDPTIDLKSDYIKTIYNLTPQDHISTMKIFAKYIDSAISKTLNLPNDYSYADFKSIYMDAYDSKYIKGFTTYREGTMTSILKKDEQVALDDDRLASKRPKKIPCDVHRIVVRGKQWKVFVGLVEDKPYEVFAGEIEAVNLPKSITDGYIIKVKQGHYAFEYDDETLIDNIALAFNNKDYDAVTRQASLALRHQIPLKYIMEQLSKSKGLVTDFSKMLSVALKKYVKDGEKGGKCPNCGDVLVFVGGCPLCPSCGASKCG